MRFLLPMQLVLLRVFSVELIDDCRSLASQHVLHFRGGFLLTALVLSMFVLPSSGQTGAPAQRSQARVINAGVPGENSTELRAAFAASLSQWHPGFITMYIGMNDAVNEKKFVPVKVFRANLKAMLDDSRKAHAVPLLVTIHHVDEGRVLKRHLASSYGDRSPNHRIDALNTVITALAREQGVALADFNGVLEKAGGANERLSPDGVHLNAPAYGLLATAVRTALPRQLQGGTTVLCLGDSLTFGIGVRPADGGEADVDGVRYLTYPAQLEKLLRR